MPLGDDQDLTADPLQAAEQQDELDNAGILPLQIRQQPMTGARCINGNLVRPDSTDEEPPSTACRQSTVMASGGVPLGRGPPGHQHSPGGLQEVYEEDAYLHLHRHPLQHQFHTLRQHPVQPPIQGSGLH